MKKEIKKSNLKERIINSFMSQGRKITSEKLLTKTLKDLQRSSNKNYKSVLQLFIQNLTPILKFNKQSKKRGKKKNITYTPYLIPNNDLRISFALKLLKQMLLKNKKKEFSKKLIQEILISVSSNSSSSIEKKNEIQKQVLAQKRYFYKFKWYK